MSIPFPEEPLLGGRLRVFHMQNWPFTQLVDRYLFLFEDKDVIPRHEGEETLPRKRREGLHLIEGEWHHPTQEEDLREQFPLE